MADPDGFDDAVRGDIVVVSHHGVSASLKYAVVERERRYLVSAVPEGVVATVQISDRYIDGTRLRLREVVAADGTTVRKLGHKVRLADGPSEVACTNFYVNNHEWALLVSLPAKVLTKKRHIIERDGLRVAVDEHADGTLIAEIDDGDSPSHVVPKWLAILKDVSHDEAWTGAELARRQP